MGAVRRMGADEMPQPNILKTLNLKPIVLEVCVLWAKDEDYLVRILSLKS